jgi:Flp pilus assembly protein TadD
MALAESRRGRLDQARTTFDRASSFCPGSVHLWQARAVLEAKAGRLDCARKHFAQVRAFGTGLAQLASAILTVDQL